MQFNTKDLWVWEFSVDGSISQLIDVAKEAACGVIVKVLDGTNFMSDFDHHPDSIDSPAKAAAVAQRFEQAGVPCSFWSVPRGNGDVQFEVKAVMEVIRAYKPRAWFLDTEPYAQFWEGTPAQATQMVTGIQGLSKAIDPFGHGTTVIACPDSRPWSFNASMDAFCAAADAIAPQCYWNAFASNGPSYKQYGFDPGDAGVTPNFVIATALKYLQKYGKPVLPIFPGDADVDTTRQGVDVVEYCKLLNFSVWRAGITNAPERGILRAYTPAGASDQGAPPDPCSLLRLADDLRQSAVTAANALDYARMQQIIDFVTKAQQGK